MAASPTAEDVTVECDRFSPRSVTNGQSFDSTKQSSSQEGSGNGDVKALGSAQIMMGVSMTTFGIFLFIDPSVAASTGTPWWSGLLSIIAGSLTVVTENNRNDKFLVKICFWSNIILCVLIGISALAFSFDVALTVIFPLFHSHSVISLMTTMIFVIFSLASLGVSITVLAIECKRTPINIKTEVAMQSIEMGDPPYHALTSPDHAK